MNPPKYDLNNLTDLHNLVDGDHNVRHNIVVHDGDVVHAAVAVSTACTDSVPWCLHRSTVLRRVREARQ